MHKLLFLALLILSNPANARIEEAIFAGGCFWRMEADFHKLNGVLATVVGFDGGTSKDPSYTQVMTGDTDYAVAVRVIYNSQQISYQDLVNYFWRRIDPTSHNAQFCDYGSQFRSAIFYLNDTQKKIALASKQKVEKIFPKVYTQITPSTQFYAAEDEHQEYYLNHPLRYKYYYYRCGYEARIKKLWRDT
ncbi:peptide-methionine (S)-S-oxide reductase MsrA [Legionella dresdenensis]|uniref:Peptide methionine sulfoxide reductase MsrA n=1 Tax=Legionella dresdenensis TaxID=450200 RepID=A0ABV8CI84_9GAMM